MTTTHTTTADEAAILDEEEDILRPWRYGDAAITETMILQIAQRRLDAIESGAVAVGCVVREHAHLVRGKTAHELDRVRIPTTITVRMPDGQFVQAFADSYLSALTLAFDRGLTGADALENVRMEVSMRHSFLTDEFRWYKQFWDERFGPWPMVPTEDLGLLGWARD